MLLLTLPTRHHLRPSPSSLPALHCCLVVPAGRAGGRRTQALHQDYIAGRLLPGTAQHTAMERRSTAMAQPKIQSGGLSVQDRAAITDAFDAWARRPEQSRESCSALARSLAASLGHKPATVLTHINRHLKPSLKVDLPTAQCKPTQSKKRKGPDGHGGGGGASLGLTVLASR